MFHLARQMEKRGWLEAIFTTYPRFKLRDEVGIPPEKVHCNWIVDTAMIAGGRFGLPLDRIAMLDQFRVWQHDQWLKPRAVSCEAFVALSGTGGVSGPIAQKAGARWFCDRGSTHHRWQIRTLKEEFARWGLEMPPAWGSRTERECEEYEGADFIVVPSHFVRRTFIEEGVAPDKVAVVPYGANLSRFRPAASPSVDEFVILFVGHFSIRKGALYLLDAFMRFRHPRKRLKIIGDVQRELKPLLSKYDLAKVDFLGAVSNADLAMHYSSANLFALPSIEEGLAMVMGEALACGTPVVATVNAGAEDLFCDAREGFIVPPRDVGALVERFELLAGDPDLCDEMGHAALARVSSLGGWDTYGATYAALLDDVLV